MRIVIPGGLGYLGSYLARRLSSRLHCTVRILTAAVPPVFESWRDEFEIIQADVTQAAQVQGCCRDCDAVVHLAALDREEAFSDPQRALCVSGAGTRNVLTEAVEARVPRVIYFSTIHVYGKSCGAVVSEDAAVAPLDDYSIAHYLGELYCQRAREQSGLTAVCLRVANGYGAPVHRSVRCWSLVVHDFCRSALAQREIIIKSAGVQERDLIPISDIGQAVELLLASPLDRLLHPVYNVGSGVTVSINEVAARVAHVYRKVYGQDVVVRRQQSSANPESGTSLTLDLRRIRELGFQPAPPRAMDEEIRRLFALLESA
jgi:UDP-glucose 4-epimerase